MVLYNSIILLNEAVRANWEIENARHKKKKGNRLWPIWPLIYWNWLINFLNYRLNFNQEK